MKRTPGVEGYLSILVLQIMYIATYLATPHIWFLQILSVIPPFLFVLPGILCLCRMVFRKDMLGILLSLSLSILGFLFVEYHPIVFSTIERDPITRKVTVVNSNTTLWYQDHPEEYMAFLQKQDADIYQLQEVIPPREKGKVDIRIFETYFPTYQIVAHHELVTLSRWPIMSEEYTEGNDFQKVTIMLSDKKIDFYNVHMRIHLLPERLFTPQYFFEDMKKRYFWRQNQFDQLLKQVNRSDSSYISGDFNTSKTMGMMRPLQEITQDSYSKSTDLFPVTWNMKDDMPWWRIDYNLVKGIQILEHHNIDQKMYSDHGAQKVTIGL